MWLSGGAGFTLCGRALCFFPTLGPVLFTFLTSFTGLGPAGIFQLVGVVRDVPARAFEHDSRSRDEFSHAIPAFAARLNGRIGEFLLDFELMMTGFTFIFVDRHGCSPFSVAR